LGRGLGARDAGPQKSGGQEQEPKFAAALPPHKFAPIPTGLGCYTPFLECTMRPKIVCE
jgi:hypothetical protein